MVHHPAHVPLSLDTAPRHHPILAATVQQGLAGTKCTTRGVSRSRHRDSEDGTRADSR